jgi:hypothetical protein
MGEPTTDNDTGVIVGRNRTSRSLGRYLNRPMEEWPDSVRMMTLTVLIGVRPVRLPFELWLERAEPDGSDPDTFRFRAIVRDVMGSEWWRGQTVDGTLTKKDLSWAAAQGTLRVVD